MLACSTRMVLVVGIVEETTSFFYKGKRTIPIHRLQIYGGEGFLMKKEIILSRG